MFRFQDIQVFVFLTTYPMIYQICDIVMSISTWDRMHFWVYLLNHKVLSHQT